jgi:hypothetical protein
MASSGRSGDRDVLGQATLELDVDDAEGSARPPYAYSGRPGTWGLAGR